MGESNATGLLAALRYALVPLPLFSPRNATASGYATILFVYGWSGQIACKRARGQLVQGEYDSHVPVAKLEKSTKKTILMPVFPKSTDSQR